MAGAHGVLVLVDPNGKIEASASGPEDLGPHEFIRMLNRSRLVSMFQSGNDNSTRLSPLRIGDFLAKRETFSVGHNAVLRHVLRLAEITSILSLA